MATISEAASTRCKQGLNWLVGSLRIMRMNVVCTYTTIEFGQRMPPGQTHDGQPIPSRLSMSMRIYIYFGNQGSRSLIEKNWPLKNGGSGEQGASGSLRAFAPMMIMKLSF